MGRPSAAIPAAAVLLFLGAAAAAFPLDWPVAKKVVTGSFGESRGDHFHSGIDIGGGEQEVHPILDGEVVFRYEENADYTTVPRGVGSFVVLQHPDNILSVYCHLKSGSMGAQRKRLAAADRLGTAGDTGYSEGTHLHIAVYDRETGSFLNPLSLLPPLRDAQPPAIRRIFLKLGDTTVPVASGVTVPPGQGEVIAEVYDPREDVRFLWAMAPYAVSLSLNGKEVSKIVFDSFQVKEGKTVIGGTRLGVRDLYASDKLVRCGSVELRGGESHLMLAVRDFAGNETVKEAFFTIKE
jgi:hypothetical protein